jgi:hypothetical protein
MVLKHQPSTELGPFCKIYKMKMKRFVKKEKEIRRRR